MSKVLSALLSALGLRSTRDDQPLAPMRRHFGPSRSFSIMSPSDWIAGDNGETFWVNSPDQAAALGGSAFRIERRPSLTEFAHARFAGVAGLNVYRQVGAERTIAGDRGLLREYVGVWPGEKTPTVYIVACDCAAEVYASVSLTVAQPMFHARRALYDTILSTFEVHADTPSAPPAG